MESCLLMIPSPSAHSRFSEFCQYLELSTPGPLAKRRRHMLFLPFLRLSVAWHQHREVENAFVQHVTHCRVYGLWQTFLSFFWLLGILLQLHYSQQCPLHLWTTTLVANTPILVLLSMLLVCHICLKQTLSTECLTSLAFSWDLLYLPFQKTQWCSCTIWSRWLRFFCC